MSAQLIDAARAALNAWAYDSSECRWHMDNLSAALAAAEAQPVGEPVAWVFNRRYGSGVQFSKPESYTDEDGSRIDPVPLYAARQRSPQPRRCSLTRRSTP